MEERALDYLAKIDELGGIVRAVEERLPRKEIAEFAFRHQREVETKDGLTVGVNAFQADKDRSIPTLKIDDELVHRQQARLAEVKARRDGARVQAAIAEIERVARDGGNLMPPVLEAVRAYATLGEVCDAFRRVFGTFRDTGRF